LAKAPPVGLEAVTRHLRILEAVEIKERLLALDDADTVSSLCVLALILIHQGQWKETEKLGVQAMKKMKRVLASEHPDG